MYAFKKMVLSLAVTESVPPPPPPEGNGFQFSSPGRESSGLACAQTAFPLLLYCEEIALDYGVQMFLNEDLSTPMGSGDLWFQEGIDGISYRITDGIITEITTCGI